MRLSPGLLGLLLATAASAQFSTHLAFQGRLEDPPGVPILGMQDVTFRLYGSSAGGAPLTSETDSIEFAAGGLFATTLGDGAPLDPNLFGQDLWVGITVDEAGGGSELAPRVSLVAAPYAHRAGAAAELATLGVTGQTLRHDGGAWVADDFLHNAGSMLGVGTTSPETTVHVAGEVRIEGELRADGGVAHQEIQGSHSAASSTFAYDFSGTQPVGGTTVTLSDPQGGAGGASAVLLVGNLNVFCTGFNSSATEATAGLYLALQKADNPGFSGPEQLTYTNTGACYTRIGGSGIDHFASAALTYVDVSPSDGDPVYYRLAVSRFGSSITAGTYHLFDRNLSLVQLAR